MVKRKFLKLAMMTMVSGALLFTGCGDSQGQSDKEAESSTQATEKNETNQIADATFTKFDKRDTWDENATVIELADKDVTIDKAGTYVLSGTLEDGQIYVNVASADKVQLVLNGVNITCKDSAAIYVENADKVSLTLAEGTENILTDGGDVTTTDADGCVFSKDDLSINGLGTLKVNGTVSNGIDCNNDIKIVSGTIIVDAVNNGIKAKQSIAIKDGNITVSAEDAVKAKSNSDETVGSFYMEGGTMKINATDDGISATVSIKITGGNISVSAEGKTTNCDGIEDVKEGCITKE